MKTVKVTEVQKQVIIIGAAAAGLVLVGVWLFVLPAFSRLAALRAEISQVDRKQAVLEESRRSLASIQDAEAPLFGEKDRHLILGYLTNLAKMNGLEADSVTPENPDSDKKTESYYHHFAIRMKVSGSFSGFLNFLNAVEKMKPAMAVSQMSMDQQMETRRGERVSKPSITLVFKTLLLKPASRSEAGK